MKLYKTILILAIGLFLTGCEDVINVNLDTAQPKLVIDASIDWAKNTKGNEQKIKLSTSTGYYSSQFPTVSGATVLVTNTANTVFNFTETPNTGEYKCNNFQPIIGETYTLTVTLNGETYKATETLTATPVIQKTIIQNNNGGFAGDEIEIKFSYQDDGTQDNFYLNSITTSHIVFPKFDVSSDQLNQGNLISLFYTQKDLKSGDIVFIKLFGTSKRFHDYFKKILIASGNDRNPFSTIPAVVRGNIINQTKSANFAFGYFRLSEVDTLSYIVQ
ncbi:DUF4249 family protein [Flavobacterium muglaense]|uniref:DUF4249 domain-containing protein n=1 Tax=Flavobacterium muglaense TaxID=2764716 RepID=A0A923SGK0_9FLAO|nr:DUF4249 family protein [Flavobacterium muglaense]MBC5839319.1 DUF4249 domain-containing protein [Flavobacterium muglaense]MBC5845817.1 DUF4249 domain-containing protein [Flavobacterium muglaense]